MPFAFELPKVSKCALLDKRNVMEEQAKNVTPETQGQVPSLMHEFQTSDPDTMPMKLLGIFLAIAILLGIGTGYLFTRSSLSSSVPTLSKDGKALVTKGKLYGSNDKTAFKDSADGMMKNGGIDGEGQYHLERSGGVSQNVYLTSSTLDLSNFMNKKVRVWGATQTAKKAGWLMDVGGVEVLE